MGKYDHLYKTLRWRKLRLAHLRRQPWCQCPEHKGQRVVAVIVDHIVPHRGDARLFWDVSNLQSLTQSCHSKWKQQIEKRNDRPMHYTADGMPLDADHHWNTATDRHSAGPERRDQQATRPSSRLGSQTRGADRGSPGSRKGRGAL